jgi:hypothetical protein
VAAQDGNITFPSRIRGGVDGTAVMALALALVLAKVAFGIMFSVVELEESGQF